MVSLDCLESLGSLARRAIMVRGALLDSRANEVYLAQVDRSVHLDLRVPLALLENKVDEDQKDREALLDHAAQKDRIAK